MENGGDLHVFLQRGIANRSFINIKSYTTFHFKWLNNQLTSIDEGLRRGIRAYNQEKERNV